MKKLLNREILLQRQQLEVTEVDLGNDEFVYVRQMTGRERDLFEQSLVTEVRNAEGKVESYDRNLTDFRAKLSVMVLCDENGDLLLKPTDYEMLSQSMSAKRLEKIVNKAQELNRITEEDKEALIKNSAAAPGGNSNSDCAES